MNNNELSHVEEVCDTHGQDEMIQRIQILLDGLEKLEEIDGNKKYKKEQIEFINKVCERKRLKVVYVIDKGEYWSMGTMKEQGSALRVVTISDWIKLMDAKIGDVQDTIHEILNGKK